MTPTNKELVARFKRLQTDRTTVQQVWQDIELYILPYRGKFFEDQSSEHTINHFEARRVWDSTATHAHWLLSSAIHGAVTNPSIRWFDMRFRDEKLNKDSSAKQFIQEAGDALFYELQESNFNLEINETYQDLCGFGTATLGLEEHDEGLNFTGVPMKESYFEPDWMGRVMRYYRYIETWRAGEIISKFGAANVPDTLIEQDKKGSLQKHKVLYTIFPTGNDPSPLGDKQDKDKRAFEYRYILEKGAHELEKGGFYEMPSFIPRWAKTSESIWGYGPSHFALADVLGLNGQRKIQWAAAEKMVDPPILVEDRALITNLSLRAASQNVVRDASGIVPLMTGGNYTISEKVIEEYRANIRDYFFTEDLRLPPVQAQPMTATEVMQRYEQMQRLMGPTLGRIQSDMLNPVLSKAFKMMARAGKLPEVPDIVMENQAQFEVEYTGPMARAQKADSVGVIERTISIAGNAAMIQANAGQQPDALDVIDMDEAIRQAGHALNAPAQILKDVDTVMKERAKREQERQKMQQAAEAQAQGQAMESQGKGVAALEAVGG